MAKPKKTEPTEPKGAAFEVYESRQAVEAPADVAPLAEGVVPAEPLPPDALLPEAAPPEDPAPETAPEPEPSPVPPEAETLRALEIVRPYGTKEAVEAIVHELGKKKPSEVSDEDLSANVSVVYNPAPEGTIVHAARQSWFFPCGDRFVPKSLADLVAGPAGCPGGSHGAQGFRQLSRALNATQTVAVRRDAIRSLVLFSRRNGGRPAVTEELDAIADGVIDGKLASTVPTVAITKEAPPPKPSAFQFEKSPFKGNIAGPFAQEEGFHKGIARGAGAGETDLPPDPEPK